MDINSPDPDPTLEINTVLELVQRAADGNQTLAPRWITDRQGKLWLVVVSVDGEYWFWSDGHVMQVL